MHRPPTKHPFLSRDMKIEHFQREHLIYGINSLGRKIEFTYQSQNTPA